MINEKEFYVLREAADNDSCLNSVHKHTATQNELVRRGLINNDLSITEDGQKELGEYRVDNAIILAAGMSTRFVPISYELPKGLISVKGEVLIERLIRQLQEAGVNQIIVVVGYMMEKFLYLRDKFHVKLVVNNEFSVKNTHSSIYVSRDHLRNTYICCSDNYYPENPFHAYEYHAFYCSIFLPGVSYVERAFQFRDDGLIIDTNKPSRDQWIMYGHAYFDHSFTDKFRPILESYFGRPGVENMYWENIYAENINELPMYIRKCQPGEILEFDSMEELKEFDKDFLVNNRVKVFENICRIFNCRPSDIQDVISIKKGLNNRSFKFKCNDNYYVYRHPGTNADNVIDRQHEAIALRTAKQLGVDDTLVFVDPDEGWKISRFVDTNETFDFADKRHVRLLAKKLKLLHDSKIKVGFHFDYRSEAERLIEYVKRLDALAYRELIACREMMKPIFRLLDEDQWQVSLCHNDIYEPNLLVEGNNLQLIDWEFAGDSDIGYDICKLFSVNNPNYEEIDEWLFDYYGRNPSKEEKCHLLACATVIYYYWFVWAVYVSKNGESIPDYLVAWYDKMNQFRNEVIKRI